MRAPSMHIFPNSNSHLALHLSFKKSRKPCSKLNLEIQIELSHREPIVPFGWLASLSSPVYSLTFFAKQGLSLQPDACATTSTSSCKRLTLSAAYTFDIDLCVLRCSLNSDSSPFSSSSYLVASSLHYSDCHSTYNSLARWSFDRELADSGECGYFCEDFCSSALQSHSRCPRPHSVSLSPPPLLPVLPVLPLANCSQQVIINASWNSDFPRDYCPYLQQGGDYLCENCRPSSLSLLTQLATLIAVKRFSAHESAWLNFVDDLPVQPPPYCFLFPREFVASGRWAADTQTISCHRWHACCWNLLLLLLLAIWTIWWRSWPRRTIYCSTSGWDRCRFRCSGSRFAKMSCYLHFSFDFEGHFSCVCCCCLSKASSYHRRFLTNFSL